MVDQISGAIGRREKLGDIKPNALLAQAAAGMLKDAPGVINKQAKMVANIEAGCQ